MIARTHFNSWRLPKYSLLTTFHCDKDGNLIEVQKSPSHKESEKHILAIQKNATLLKQHTHNLTVLPCTVKNNCLSMPIASGSSLDDDYRNALLRQDSKAASKLIQEVIDIVNNQPIAHISESEVHYIENLFKIKVSEDKGLQCSYIDFNLDNILKDYKGYTLIDYEFCIDAPAPKSVIYRRIIASYLYRYGRLTMQLASKDMPVVKVGPMFGIPDSIFSIPELASHLTQKGLEASIQQEHAFQATVSILPYSVELSEEHTTITSPEHLIPEEINQRKIELLEEQLRQTAQHAQNLSDALEEKNNKKSKRLFG